MKNINFFLFQRTDAFHKWDDNKKLQEKLSKVNEQYFLECQKSENCEKTINRLKDRIFRYLIINN